MKIELRQFTLAGEHGFARLACQLVQGAHCRATLTVENWGYRAEGKLWFATAALTAFHDELTTAYEKLSGSASFTSRDGHLRLTVTFTGRSGDVVIEGSYQEVVNSGNELRFRIQSDQSFIGQTLPELEALVDGFEALPDLPEA